MAIGVVGFFVTTMLNKREMKASHKREVDSLESIIVERDNIIHDIAKDKMLRKDMVALCKEIVSRTCYTIGD